MLKSILVVPHDGFLLDLVAEWGSETREYVDSSNEKASKKVASGWTLTIGSRTYQASRLWV